MSRLRSRVGVSRRRSGFSRHVVIALVRCTRVVDATDVHAWTAACGRRSQSIHRIAERHFRTALGIAISESLGVAAPLLPPCG